MLDGLLNREGVDREVVKEGCDLIAKACELYETQTDHRYLGDRRRGWRVSREDARQSEIYRRRIAQMIVEMGQ